MPKNFYQRVLEMEKQVEKYKENCSEPLLKGLMHLYSEAIEYFGFMDQPDKCMQLQMRMQSILVRPYVLDCLTRFENKRYEEEKASQAQKKKIVLKSSSKMESDVKKRKSRRITS